MANTSGDKASSSEEQSVIVERRGGVAILTINRPDVGNAVDHDTAVTLMEQLDALHASGDCRAVLLRSNGKHFCTGADISRNKKENRESSKPSIGHMLRSLAAGPHALIEALWNAKLPIVAEVKGRTSGMGLHMALACDLTVCAESASFAEPFTARGFNVDSGGSWLLPHYIGLARAKTLLYTAEPIDARTALDWGLVSELVPDAELESRALQLTEKLAAGATFAIGVTKSLVHQGLDSTLEEQLEREAYGVEISIRSDDFKEGMRAFFEKRPPDFTGH